MYYISLFLYHADNSHARFSRVQSCWVGISLQLLEFLVRKNIKYVGFNNIAFHRSHILIMSRCLLKLSDEFIEAGLLELTMMLE